MRFLVSVVVNALAIWVATWLLSGMSVDSSGGTGSQLVTYLAIGLVFGLVNAIIRPIVVILSIPFYILTLGLFTFIVNALMLWLTSSVAGWVGLGFHVDDFFWTAILGALVISVVSVVVNGVLATGRSSKVE